MRLRTRVGRLCTEIDSRPCTADLRFHALYGAGLHWYKGGTILGVRSASRLLNKKTILRRLARPGQCRRHLGDARGAQAQA